MSHSVVNDTDQMTRPPVSADMDNTTEEVVVVDDEGDLFLKSGNTKFLVAKKVLTLVSPYFRAMFKPGFAEASLLSQQDTDKPPTIELFDDSTTAVKIVMRIFHWRDDREYLDLSLDTILEIAKLSDKYDFTRAIQMKSEDWLEHANHLNVPEEKNKRQQKLLEASFLFCNGEYFWKTLDQLARGQTATDVEEWAPAQCLPEGLKGASNAPSIFQC